MSLFTLDEIPTEIARILPAESRLEFPPQGMTSDVAFAVGRERSVVVKRCGHPVYVHWLRREHAAFLALVGTALPIPSVMRYEELARGSGPEGWLVTSWLPGRSLWRAVLERAPGTRTDVFRALGTLMRRLHSTPIPRAFAAQTPWLARTLAQAETNLAWCDGTAELLGELRRTTPAAAPAALIHGDLALDNVLIAENGELSLIDWPGGGSGDPRYDVAIALQTLPETSLTSAEQRAFYEGYGGPELDEYTRRWFELLYEFF